MEKEIEGCESIKVLVRLRTALAGESALGDIVVGEDGESISVRSQGHSQARPSTPKSGGGGDWHSFKFDNIMHGGSTQEEVFEMVRENPHATHVVRMSITID